MEPNVVEVGILSDGALRMSWIEPQLKDQRQPLALAYVDVLRPRGVKRSPANAERQHAMADLSRLQARHKPTDWRWLCSGRRPRVR